jgi:sensor c-di-GMP phosphodiesterase-like protein
VLLRTKRQKVGAIVAVALFAGLSLLFNYWVDRFVTVQGHEEVAAMAQRKTALADERIDRVVDILSKLRQRGVDSCDPPHMQILQQTALSFSMVKDIVVFGDQGEILCSTLGTAGERKLVASQPAPVDPNVVLEVLTMSDAIGPMLRVRLLARDSGRDMALTILGSRLISRRSEMSPTGDGYRAVSMRDGTVIDQAERPEVVEVSEDRFVASHVSERYGIATTASLGRASMEADAARLRLFGLGIFVSIALLLMAALFLMSRRQRDNPIAEMERALDAGEFVPYYQPIMDLVTGKLRGGEVLIRWRKPDGSTVSPAVFIPLAESSGIILDMTRTLMRRVRQEIGPAFAGRPHLKICFNLAAQHFQDDDIVRDIRDIFGRGPIAMSQIVLEVTERQPIENLAETRRLIATLQQLGVRMALDDVGTGHSGLSYILKLGVDIIKIDKMFVDAIGIDRSSTTIIETLVDLAHNMRMDIVAEGVETFEQVVCLRERGIRAAQGFVFAPPLPGASFLQLIEAIEPMQAAAPETAAVKRAVA